MFNWISVHNVNCVFNTTIVKKIIKYYLKKVVIIFKSQ